MSERVYRVQAADGRGPFRPGFTLTWSDLTGDDRLPTWIDEFGDLSFRPDKYYGTAVRTIEDIGRWFTLTEQHRLAVLGYSVVAINVDRVLAESENQLVFERSAPLRVGVVIVPWPKEVLIT